MSNIFCSEGVEFKALKDVYLRIKGTPITAREMREIDTPDGNIKVFAGGKTVINTFENKIKNANITRVPAVIVQSRGIIDFIFCDEPFTFKNEMWAYTCDEKISVKFLYYVLKNNVDHFRKIASKMGTIPQISLPATENFRIPFPPLEVQREIASILDRLSSAVTELEFNLKRELELRRKQYEYYRDKLLTFNEKE